MKDQIEELLQNLMPGFYIQVAPYQGFSGDYLKIMVACDEQRTQAVSLSLNEDTLWLEPQGYGGIGGQAIYRKPNMNDAKEKYLAMKSMRIPFRRPQQNEQAILKAIAKFFTAYKDTLLENIDVLEYQDKVDYRKLLF